MPRIAMGHKSMVAKASNKSPSVRTTIPEDIVKEAKIVVGDVLDWEIQSEESGRLIMKVKKLE